MFALSVARRLDLMGQPVVFILAGGIFRAVPWLEQELERRLPVAAPGSRVRSCSIASPRAALSRWRCRKRAAGR